jgi:hypothetical protein
MNDVRRDAHIGGLLISQAQTQAGEEAAARRLQWEAAERMSKMQLDARCHEMRVTIVWMAIASALIFTLPPAIEFYVGCTP